MGDWRVVASQRLKKSGAAMALKRRKEYPWLRLAEAVSHLLAFVEGGLGGNTWFHSLP